MVDEQQWMKVNRRRVCRRSLRPPEQSWISRSALSEFTKLFAYQSPLSTACLSKLGSQISERWIVLVEQCRARLTPVDVQTDRHCLVLPEYAHPLVPSSQIDCLVIFSQEKQLVTDRGVGTELRFKVRNGSLLCGNVENFNVVCWNGR